MMHAGKQLPFWEAGIGVGDRGMDNVGVTGMSGVRAWKWA